MNTLEDIKEGFAQSVEGYRVINSLPLEYTAYTMKIGIEYGVFIVYENGLDVTERFNSCRLYTRDFFLHNNKIRGLVLSSFENEFRNEFASICNHFIDPGINGTNRERLLRDPLSWWEKWKDLLGNVVSHKEPYSVIGEMLSLCEAFKKDKTAIWHSVDAGSHDIETRNGNIEVKSTVLRYGTLITITGQHQLLSNRNQLEIYFCRFEKSSDGVSIDDVRDLLIDLGYDNNRIERELYKLGYEKGASIRRKKYKVLEKRKYLVDSSFPRITKDSFKEGKIPESIVKIQYTINLEALPYETW